VVSRWNVPDNKTYIASDIITSPTAHLLIYSNTATLSITLGRRTLEAKGEGVMTGIKFRPGGLCAYNKDIIPRLVNSSIPASKVFEQINSQFIKKIDTLSDEDIVRELEYVVRSQRVVPDKHIELINTILREMRAHNHLVTINDVAMHCDIPERTLQYLFKTYLGLPPKWFLMRDRLLKALQEAHRSNRNSWTDIAADLGYSSQSHFISDFKRIIGMSPSEYIKHLSA
jgi:AraC-like DNA-binding protein